MSDWYDRNEPEIYFVVYIIVCSITLCYLILKGILV